MIIYKQGNLFESTVDIIIHGVNCQGAFGSGVAGQISENYPKAKAWYLDKHFKEGWKLGQIQPVMFENGKFKYIINCATQDEYYPRNKCHADYNAIEECMKKVKEFVKEHGYTVACPKIGAGLAGGSWDIIEAIINKVFDDCEIICYYL